jgi:hypothetical protein
MSAKATLDKTRPSYPWTARQKRQKVSGRLTRKQMRVVTRNI